MKTIKVEVITAYSEINSGALEYHTRQENNALSNREVLIQTQCTRRRGVISTGPRRRSEGVLRVPEGALRGEVLRRASMWDRDRAKPEGQEFTSVL